MIPIFEYKDLFNGNEFTISENPLINELQETVRNGFVKGEIIGVIFDAYGCEDEYTVNQITEYNKYYIFHFLADKYPDYGFLDGEGNLSFKEGFFTLNIEPIVINIK